MKRFTALFGVTALLLSCTNVVQEETLPISLPETEYIVVIFEPENGEAAFQTSALKGSLVSQPSDPLRIGFLFQGWYLDKDGQLIWDFKEESADSDMTLYAFWVREPQDAKEFINFSLHDSHASIEGNLLKLVLPWRTRLNGLVARFETTGISVNVDGTNQVSGMTPNDFTSPIVYTILAENSTTKQYTVIVSLAKFPKSALHHWDFVTIDSNVISDTLQGYEAVLTGNSVLGDEVYGTSLLLDGVSNGLTAPDPFTGETVEPFSIEVTVRMDSLSSFRYIVNQWAYTTVEKKAVAQRSWSLNLESGNLVWRASTNGLDSGESRTSVPITEYLSQWVHIIGVFTGDELVLYLNGAETGRTSISGIISTSNPLFIGVGDYGQSYRMFGGIKATTIYSTALEADEVDYLAQEAKK